jgi:hypothetical protein
MASNEYHFISHWRVIGTCDEVAKILSDAPDLVRWWPSVYLEVRELAPGDAHGVGKEVALYTKGWLPYTLRWQFRVTESDPPRGFAIEATGDFVGCGEWSFTQDGDAVSITYDWRIRADKLLLRYGSFVFRPIFAANHRWAMARGEESLKLELARRHAKSDAERARIAGPPGRTHWPLVTPVLLSTAVACLLLYRLVLRAKR